VAYVSSQLRMHFALAAVLFAACETLPAQVQPGDLGAAAKLVTLAGQISVLRDNNPWALNVGDLVQPQQVIVTGIDGYGVFQVSDGSKFEVFPKSRVVFRANRGDWKDLLELFLGKVRVQIEHPGGLPNRNKVYTPSAVISVRGTIFDVEVEDEDATTLVLDEEGQVEVRHRLNVSSQPLLLDRGEWIRVYKNAPIARKVVDKGAILQHAVKAASDAFYQAALNAAHNAGSVVRGGVPATTGPTTPADQDKSNPPPPPPPPPPAPAAKQGSAPAAKN
jgi:hypothetical protein